MIKLQDLTPDVYYNQSRDFQFIGRLYDLLLNYNKTSIDTIYKLPIVDDDSSKLVDLWASTVGFRPKHHYNTAQLVSICSIFPTILKNKGSINAIKLACNAILHASGVTDSVEVETDIDDFYNITIFIPTNDINLTLVKDVLEYILPAGVSCNIIKELRVSISYTQTIELEHNAIITQTRNSEVSKWTKFTIPGKEQTVLADATGHLYNSTLVTDDVQLTETSNENSEDNNNE